MKRSITISFLSKRSAIQTTAVLLLPLLMCGCLTLSTPNLDSELVVGVTKNNAPFFIGTEKGPSGLEVDLAQQLAEELKKTVRFVVMPEHKLAPAVDGGTIDIIMNGVMVTTESRESVSFALPYLQNGEIIVVREGDADGYQPASKIKATQAKIAVVNDSRGQAYAQAYCSSASIVNVSTAKKAFTSLMESRVDVVVIDAVTASYMCPKFPGIIMVLEPLTAVDVAWAVDPVNFKLLDNLNAARSAWLRDGSLNKVINQWIPGYNEMGFDK